MPVNSINSTNTAAPGTVSGAQQTLALGKDAFMSMLIANLRNQDPSSAGDSKEFVNQLSQMTMLEQITNMASATETLAAEQRQSSAISMIGKTVTYATGSGTTETGVVEKVTSSSGVLSLTVGGVPNIAFGQITEVGS
jgi:flagellar basal-body rod modification protein FlgD